MDKKRDLIQFLSNWYFRPQRDVQGFHELCRPDGTVVSMMPTATAERLAAALVGETLSE